jgi:hypothetical protein
VRDQRERSLRHVMQREPNYWHAALTSRSSLTPRLGDSPTVSDVGYQLL